MGPISSGFMEVRSLFDKEVNEIIQDFQKTNDMTRLKEVRQNRAGAFVSAQGRSGWTLAGSRICFPKWKHTCT